jgi:hypothetical protein
MPKYHAVIQLHLTLTDIEAANAAEARLIAEQRVEALQLPVGPNLYVNEEDHTVEVCDEEFNTILDELNFQVGPDPAGPLPEGSYRLPDGSYQRPDAEKE